jgi:hypothetical protein
LRPTAPNTDGAIENALIEYQMFRYNRLETFVLLSAIFIRFVLTRSQHGDAHDLFHKLGVTLGAVQADSLTRQLHAASSVGAEIAQEGVAQLNLVLDDFLHLQTTLPVLLKIFFRYQA